MTQINEMVKNLLEELKEIVRTETVVGQPIQAGDSTVIPVSKVVFGFGGGGGTGQTEKKDAGGGTGIGGGASIEPLAFIVITEGKSQLLSVKEKGGITPGKVVDLLPEIIEQLKGFKSKKGKEKESEKEKDQTE